MKTINNVHQQFANFFNDAVLEPYAYLVSKRLSEGHICVPLENIEEELVTGPYFFNASMVIEDQLQRNGYVGAAGDNKPFILHNRRLYLQRYFAYESAILQQLQAFVQNEELNLQERMAQLLQQKQLINQLFGDNENTSATVIPWQRVAALLACLHNFTIITGGPGTGKTTTVAKILALLLSIEPGLKVALAAPTGKAAMRMAESLQKAAPQMPGAVQQAFAKLETATIHKLLQQVSGTPYFKYNSQNTLPYQIVIIDEASMIDAALFAKLLTAIDSGTRVIMLGDKDQLASVEAGSLFGDICGTSTGIPQSEADFLQQFLPPKVQLPAGDTGTSIMAGHVIELKTSHRFSNDKGIGKLSRAIIQNDAIGINEFIDNTDSEVVIDTTYNDQLFEQFIDAYTDYIVETDIQLALQKLNTARVLCAVRDGEQGLYAINRKIERYLQHKKLIKPGAEFYEHRPVMITRNYYDLGLFNGDIGIIRFDENKVLKAWFLNGTELRQVLPGFIADAETVFAMTIHKSQGSEYDQVMVILPNNADLPLLTAELLYTGVTRAKNKVYLQASENVLEQSAGRRVSRASGIVDRL